MQARLGMNLSTYVKLLGSWYVHLVSTSKHHFVIYSVSLQLAIFIFIVVIFNNWYISVIDNYHSDMPFISEFSYFPTHCPIIISEYNFFLPENPIIILFSFFFPLSVLRWKWRTSYNPKCFHFLKSSLLLTLFIYIYATLDLQVIHQKYRISYDEITNDLCPVSLSVTHILIYSHQSFSYPHSHLVTSIFLLPTFSFTHINLDLFRYWVSSSCIEYAHCTGIAIIILEVYPQM